jgi:hypothetical protein
VSLRIFKIPEPECVSMSSAALTEPQVLDHTKRRLFPEEDAESTYAVVDTQFAQEKWLDERRVDPEIQTRLAPFNHVKVGSGYPDLVGVRTLDDELLAIERLGDTPPLVAVEAKGYTNAGGADVERGIVQAYDRLDEANVAFLAAPAEAISSSARTMARELNVGVLAVDASGHVATVVEPRVVGTQTTNEAAAIRFQASAQGVADKSFSLNHPKNYLAYPLALVHDRDTETVLKERVVKATAGARTGATFLNLIEDGPSSTASGGEPSLTPLGEEVVRFALREYDSVDDALDEFDNWKRSRKRFCDLAPRWGQLTRRVVYDYPATQLLVEELQTMHDDGFATPSLVNLVTWLHEQDDTAAFTVELFLRGTDDVRQRVLREDGSLRTEELADGNVYHSPTVFQLKTILYHAGILTENGTEPSNLDPTADEWALREPLARFR